MMSAGSRSSRSAGTMTVASFWRRGSRFGRLMPAMIVVSASRFRLSGLPRHSFALTASKCWPTDGASSTGFADNTETGTSRTSRSAEESSSLSSGSARVATIATTVLCRASKVSMASSAIRHTSSTERSEARHTYSTGAFRLAAMRALWSSSVP